MPDTRRRWFISIVLGIGAIAFLSLSVTPLISALINRPSLDPSAQDVPSDQLQEQIDGYQAVLEREPENQIALQNLAQLWLQMGDLDEAAVPLAKLVELNPEQTDLAVLLAQIKIETGFAAEGAAILATVYENDPDNTQLLETLVNAEVEAGDSESAIARLADRDDFDSTLLRAQILTRSGDLAAAIPIYDELLAENPLDYRVMIGKGIALSSGESPNTQAALNLFTAAADAAPEELQPQIREIARIYVPTATPDAAIETTEPDAAPETDEPDAATSEAGDVDETEPPVSAE